VSADFHYRCIPFSETEAASCKTFLCAIDFAEEMIS
jgi:hypothetical protein